MSKYGANSLVNHWILNKNRFHPHKNIPLPSWYFLTFQTFIILMVYKHSVLNIPLLVQNALVLHWEGNPIHKHIFMTAPSISHQAKWIFFLHKMYLSIIQILYRLHGKNIGIIQTKGEQLYVQKFYTFKQNGWTKSWQFWAYSHSCLLMSWGLWQENKLCCELAPLEETSKGSSAVLAIGLLSPHPA